MSRTSIDTPPTRQQELLILYIKFSNISIDQHLSKKDTIM